MFFDGEVYAEKRFWGYRHGASLKVAQETVVVATPKADAMAVASETHTGDDAQAAIGLYKVDGIGARLQNASRGKFQIRESH